MTQQHYLTQQDKYLPLAFYTIPVIEVCCARGVKQDKLLRGTGIFKTDIIEGKTVSVSQILRLFTNAKSLTPGNDCAFQIGRAIASQQHSVTHALAYSRNFEESLRIIKRFEGLCSPFIGATLLKENNCGYWLMRRKFDLGKLEQFILEIFTTAMVSLSQRLLGQRIKFHFGFTWQRPSYIQEYEENLGYRVHFEQPINMIAAELPQLQRPNLTPNNLMKWHELRKSNAEVTTKTSLLEHVRATLLQWPNLSLPQAAEKLGMSAATLKRKLSEQAVSFTKLQYEVRKHQAIYYLLLQNLNNEQSASLMHISDITNFRRAIKSWTGYTPSQLKQLSPLLPLY